MLKNKNIATILIVIAILFSTSAFAQSSLQLEECYEKARNNYPTIQQMQLIEKSSEYNIANANRNFLPQIAVNGQASYQSDVTSVPVNIPGFNIPQVAKDQYKAFLEINQPLTNIRNIRTQKDMLRANTVAEKEKVEVALYSLKSRINQIFFGILLIDEQLQQTALMKQDLSNAIKKTKALVDNGVATKINSYLLEAEEIKVSQKQGELKANRTAFTNMLGILINEKLNGQTKLAKPVFSAVNLSFPRPELRLFDAQQKSIFLKNKQLNNRIIPQIGLFLQAGYGRPALNMLNNEFDTYYIGGARLKWDLSSLYTRKNERNLLDIQSSQIDIQKETFKLNTNFTLAQQNEEVKKYNTLLQTDDVIIALRNKIKTTANVQLENGIISPLDYITYLNAEDQAKQNQLLHKIQLLLAQANSQTTAGN